MLVLVLVAHFVMAVLAPVLTQKFATRAFLISAIVPAVSFIALVVQAPAVLSDNPPTESIPWIPQLQLDLSFRLDPLSWLLALLVTGVGTLILVYSAFYFSDDDQAISGVVGQLVAFSGSMVGLVTADNTLLLFIFWEATTILSYLLIGYAQERLSARRAATQALLVTTFGGLAMLVGIIMLGEHTGTYSLQETLAAAPNGVIVNVAIYLILAGVFSKSAMFPFSFWLPAAMAAPTPVSAYLHAAAMVKAGIYLLARLAPTFHTVPGWVEIVVGSGIITMLFAGWHALRQTDLKLLLAYSTVSQLGLLAIVTGIGSYSAALAGVTLVLAHGLSKSLLFLVVGIIDHNAGTRDLTKLSGIGKQAPLLLVLGTLAAASMAGLPPTLGFLAKEAAFSAFLLPNSPWFTTVALIAIALGSVLTFGYSARYIWGAFSTKPSVQTTDFGKISRGFLVSPLVLAVPILVGGFLGTLWENLIAPYAEQYNANSSEKIHLVLWHGFSPALFLTIAVIFAGIALFALRDRVILLQQVFSIPERFDGEHIYAKVIYALDRSSVWVTGKVQRGSLPFYLSVILAVVLVLPGSALLFGLANPEITTGESPVYAFDNPAQLLLAATIAASALIAATTRKRFMAALILSVVGYGTALIFALQGAPDLALTQALVETITLVAFVLIFRKLPQKMPARKLSVPVIWRALIGISVSGILVGLAILSASSRTAEPISLQFPQLAYEGGGGLNIVNVTLVDIRAWDTMGEISVLVAAATGIASLVFLRKRPIRFNRAQDIQTGAIGRIPQSQREPGGHYGLAETSHDQERGTWLLGSRTLAPERRSIVFEVVTRLLFHTFIVVSLYFLLAGHNSPGGGFVAGLVAGGALVVRYLAGGPYELAEAIPVDAGKVLGAGLLLAALAGITPLFFGGNVLQTAILTFDLPIFGHIKFVTSLFFDVGVYLVVVGLVLDVLRSLGVEVDKQSDPAYRPQAYRDSVERELAS